MQSELDEAVRKIREDVTHDWGLVVIDGISDWYCTRCGKRKTDCGLDVVPWWTPCKGFI
jgi:hypothetical protein